jgi:hypothetical protein
MLHVRDPATHVTIQTSSLFTLIIHDLYFFFKKERAAIRQQSRYI